jgi:hypothetical protein
LGWGGSWFPWWSVGVVELGVPFCLGCVDSVPHGFGFGVGSGLVGGVGDGPEVAVGDAGLSAEAFDVGACRGASVDSTGAVGWWVQVGRAALVCWVRMSAAIGPRTLSASMVSGRPRSVLVRRMIDAAAISALSVAVPVGRWAGAHGLFVIPAALSGGFLVSTI